jgi:hypothetical protein
MNLRQIESDASSSNPSHERKDMRTFRQWKVTRRGLETVSRYCAHDVRKDTLDDVREVNGRCYSDWLIHMAEKNWVIMSDFIEVESGLQIPQGEHQLH